MTPRHLDRCGVRIAYRVVDDAGPGAPAVLFLPVWQLVDSRIWDVQLAALAGRARMITFDARGSGWSTRPADPAAYAPAEIAADALAVLDDTGTDRAVLVGNSFGGALAMILAALHPDRVAGLVLIGATVDVTGDPDAPIVAAGQRFETDLGPGEQGWDRYNRHAWRRDFPGFVRWFLQTAAPEPHVATLRERAITWALDQDPEILAATLAPRLAVPPPQQATRFAALADAVRCPAVVVHGEHDAIVPPAWGAALADRLGARHVVLPGAGHCPQISEPTTVAALVSGALERNLA